MTTYLKLAGATRSAQGTAARSDVAAYRRHVAAPRALFAAPQADLLTLVIADAIKRKAQAEIQRDALREALYEMPAPQDHGHDRRPDLHPSDFDE